MLFEDTYVFQEKDPRGETVSLEWERVESHIHVEHPEVDLEEIRECISDPEYIIVDTTHTNRENYYAHKCFQYPSLYVKTVVSISRKNDTGRKVVTSYYTKEVSPLPSNSEDILYDKKKNNS